MVTEDYLLVDLPRSLSFGDHQSRDHTEIFGSYTVDPHYLQILLFVDLLAF